MECDICSRVASLTLPFHCITCARNAVYDARLKTTKVLLEKEDLGKRIECIVTTNPSDGKYDNNKTSKQDESLSQAWSHETASTKKTESDGKAAVTKKHIAVLRDDMKSAKEDIRQRKASLASRRAEMQAIKASVPDRRSALTMKATETVRKGSQSWTGIHHKTIETRAFLCREAATLYRLKQKRKAKGGSIVDQYAIGGLPVVDLKDINSMRTNELSSAFASLAQLLVLVSFYLSVRLPAEITLPHRDYPQPTIFAPANSYLGREIPYPGTTPNSTSSNSPSASRHIDVRPLPRPRPLFLDSKDVQETVPQFAKRDPIAFNFFLEGISLFAWNVAWVCRTQKFYLGTETWDEVCNVGRNLWHLLLAPVQSPALTRVRSTRDVQSRKAGKENAVTNLARAKSLPRLGSISHSSAYSFLGGAESQELLRSWRISKYTTIVDPLKKALIAEMNNAEWELLEEQEWDDGGERFDGDAAVVVKNRTMDSHQFDDARSVMTTRTKIEESAVDLNDSTGPGRVKGTSGWTKLRGRDK